MATIINIDSELGNEKFKILLQKGVQSASLNFIVGSGCSLPALDLKEWTINRANP